MSAEKVDYGSFLSERRQVLLGRISDAARRSGRDASDITLLAVSKTIRPEDLAAARAAGYRRFGENRPQELVRKAAVAMSDPDLSDVRFDMIGNLQKNKINQVLSADPLLIHSLSSLHLAEAISRRAQAREVMANVLIEVNVSGEESKAGFSVAEALEACEPLAALPALHIAGVMTMAPAHDLEAARRTFAALRDVRDELRTRMGLELPVTSCGMSDDFEVAVEEGSTLVRLGRIVFDPGYRMMG